MDAIKELMNTDESRPDPCKVFKAIADIIADREGIRVALKSVSRKDKTA